MKVLAAWLLLTWGSTSAPTLRPGGADELPHGPTAIAATADALWIADPADREILRIGRDKTVTAVTSPFRAVDIAVDGQGRIAIMEEGSVRVAWKAGAEEWVQREVPDDVQPLRRIAWDSQGGLWGLKTDGCAVLVNGDAVAREEERALPLAGPPAHALAKVGEGDKAAVWVWPWDAPAKFQSVRSRRVSIGAAERIGSLLPLAHDETGRLDVLVETLNDEAGLRVHLEVRRLDAEGRESATLSFAPAKVCPVYRPVAIGPDGSLWLVYPKPEGLAIYRVDSKEWRGRLEVEP